MKQYLSFSKLLSRRILMVNIATISVIALLVIAFAIVGLKSMTNAYFVSGLYAAHESIDNRFGKMSADSLYRHIKMMDVGFNAFNPLFKDTNEKDDKDVWAYNVVVDSVGNYIYHPDRQRIGKGNLFDDIRQSGDALCQELAQGLNSGRVGEQKITMDGAASYIFYNGVKDNPWRNVIIVPKNGLLIPLIITGLILLAIIVVGLLAAYWVSRFTIRRATIPLRLLTKSADEVAKGNFQTPLPELRHNDEISQLRDAFGNMQQSLTQYIDQLQTTTAQKAAMESELSIARNIQLAMVPTEFPERDQLNLYASMTPAKAVGGDLYDFFVHDNRLVFCIGDVSGKGVPAALLMTVAKNLFRAYASDGSTPDSIVTRMNNDLSRNNQECMLVTFFVGILDLSSGLLRYCNAGHEAPILINKTVEPLPVNQILPLGIMEDTPYLTQEIVIEPQTTVLLYTDGLDEATDADEKLFGNDRIIDELNRAIQDGQLSPKAVIDRMTQAVHAFVGDAEQSDDLTMLCLRFLMK
ncbi:MAG: SpoIIE family protein phosphatase [Prevotella sp.]|nr:SpoIIE family protein phosphatase [Prevotella sp.]